MNSFKSRLINFMIRNRHLMRGKLKKETYTETTSITAFRELCEKGANKYAKIPKGVNICVENAGGIHAEWLRPQGASTEKVIMYVHGGGYVSGSCNDHRSFVSQFAKNCGYSNLVFEYRLAPENPFPAALDDSVAVYKWLLSQGFEAKNIIIAGESAGGGLCLVTLLALKDAKIPLPVAALAISPWTDLTCSGESYRTKNKVSAAPLNSWFVFAKHYAGNNEFTNPYISPLFGDLKGLPPIFINAGESDELFDDGEQFYVKAKKAGVDVTFRAGKNMIHCYPLLAPMFREATEAMEEICDFVKKHLKEKP